MSIILHCPKQSNHEGELGLVKAVRQQREADDAILRGLASPIWWRLDDDFDLAVLHESPAEPIVDDFAFLTAEADFEPEPLMPFDAWIDAQASYYRSTGTLAGEWLAEQIADLAAQARFLSASSPMVFEDRRQCMSPR